MTDVPKITSIEYTLHRGDTTNTRHRYHCFVAGWQVAQERIAELEAERDYERSRADTLQQWCTNYATPRIAELAGERALNQQLQEAAVGLVNSTPSSALDEVREIWSNTNVAVIEHWRLQVASAISAIVSSRPLASEQALAKEEEP